MLDKTGYNALVGFFLSNHQFLSNLCFVCVIRGHQAAVLCVHFNDTKLVSGSCDKAIKVSTILQVKTYSHLHYLRFKTLQQVLHLW